MRLVLVVSAVAMMAAAVGNASPAQAIETTEFSINPVGGAARINVDLRAGATTHGKLEVANKTKAPLALHLGVIPATVESGTASVGGDTAAAGWVKLSQHQVQLLPGERRVVPFQVNPPRELTAGGKTVGIVAEPAAQNATVVQRLAVVVYLKPTGSLRAALGWIAWIAAGLCALTATWAASTTRRRRSRNTTTRTAVATA